MKIIKKHKTLQCNPSKTPLEVKITFGENEMVELVNSTNLMGRLDYPTWTKPDKSGFPKPIYVKPKAYLLDEF